MKSKYKRLGDFIQRVNIRNSDLKTVNLLGINIDKYFMPSVANTIGTDLSKYKIVQKNQFACNRMHVGRDDRLPVALSSSDDDFIVSPAYDVFEIIDTEKLLPKYLMMWFSREEFDRNAWFYTDSDVRGKLDWNDFCDMKLPIPSPTKQKEIVKEYETITNRIKLNEQLTQKLEDTAQTIYKHWFVDFEFPNKDGKPYKSSGGKMVYNDELDMEVPEGWEVLRLKNVIEYKKGYAFKSNDYVEEGVKIVKVSNFTENSINMANCDHIEEAMFNIYEQYRLNTDDILISTVGSWPNNPKSVVGKVLQVPMNLNNCLLNQNSVRIKMKDYRLQNYLFLHLKNKKYSNYIISGAQGSANQASVTLDHLFSYCMVLPNEQNIKKLTEIFIKIRKQQNVIFSQNEHLSQMKEIMLSKISSLMIV